MNIVQLRVTQSHLEYLTGCRYATLVKLAKVVKSACFAKTPGRPMKLGLWHSLALVSLVFMKFRQGLSGMALEALTGVDAVTLSRYVQKVLAVCERVPLAKGDGVRDGFLVVDTTSVRVRSRCLRSFSGHKSQRCAKVQVVASATGQALHVGRSWPGSVHDKTVYDRERVTLAKAWQSVMLADKAYAGVHDEGQVLLRPVKRGEIAWHEDPEAARAYNRALGRQRVRIEHLFARLKTFKVVQGPFAYAPAQLARVFRALALAHNLNREADHPEPAC